MSNQDIHKVVIVGGGAGGLELATKLGIHLAKKESAYHTGGCKKNPSMETFVT